MNVFAYSDYCDLLRAWLRTLPKEGRGVAQKLAAHLRVSSVLMSQVLGGTRTLQADYAFGIAQFMGLSAGESDYFLLLVQHEYAGTAAYKEHLKKKIETQQANASEIKGRVPRDIQLSEETRARFYSHWHYSAIRLLTDLPNTQAPKAIAEALKIEIARVHEILEFLVDNKLCIRQSGRFQMAVRNTHLENESPWIYSRQLQWRQKALQSMESPRKDSLFYTGPMVLSNKDRAWVRERLVELVKEVSERVRASPSESLACLNIDWFCPITLKNSESD
jgi:uncharacterized protein (TIGR02147 family)